MQPLIADCRIDCERRAPFRALINACWDCGSNPPYWGLPPLQPTSILGVLAQRLYSYNVKLTKTVGNGSHAGTPPPRSFYRPLQLSIRSLLAIDRAKQSGSDNGCSLPTAHATTGLVLSGWLSPDHATPAAGSIPAKDAISADTIDGKHGLFRPRRPQPSHDVCPTRITATSTSTTTRVRACETSPNKKWMLYLQTTESKGMRFQTLCRRIPAHPWCP